MSVETVPVCGKCDGTLRYNVPRLGPAGGYVHADTGSLTCEGNSQIANFVPMTNIFELVGLKVFSMVKSISHHGENDGVAIIAARDENEAFNLASTINKSPWNNSNPGFNIINELSATCQGEPRVLFSYEFSNDPPYE